MNAAELKELDDRLKREAARAKSARWRAANPHKVTNAEVRRKRRAKYADENSGLKAARLAADLIKRYGITPQAKAALLDAQGGVCSICKSGDTGKIGHDFCLDHCHSTGKVRGVLCHHCNKLLGFAKDNASLLRVAAEYLEVNRD